jgi:hypothetical protein
MADGCKIRPVTIIDPFTRECLGIEVGFSLRAAHVVAAMDCPKGDRALPQRVSCYNVLGPEAGFFASDNIPRGVPRRRAIKTGHCARGTRGTRGLPQ